MRDRSADIVSKSLRPVSLPAAASSRLALRRAVALGLAGLSLTLVVGCGGRSRARLNEIERTVGNSSVITEYEYDDQGRLSGIRVNDGGDPQEWEIEYGDDGVDQITVSEGDGEPLVINFSYDDGRLTEKDESGPGYTVDSELTYDDSGQLSEVERSYRAGSNTTVTTRYTLERDAGKLDSWTSNVHSVVEVPLLGTLESTEVTTREHQYDDDGNLEQIEVTVTAGNDTSSADIDYEYEDGRLVEVSDINNERVDVNYDDNGRIDEVEYANSGNRYELSYEDSPTSGGLYLEPQGIDYGGFFFDLEGHSYGEFDLNTLSVLLNL